MFQFMMINTPYGGALEMTLPRPGVLWPQDNPTAELALQEDPLLVGFLEPFDGFNVLQVVC
ncbi:MULTISPECIES: hypothetical protein [Pseudomonas]|uniref:Uncharacterized protein n=1 Tax=Pseudomonas reactans TaxID=117680 RepID=A0A7Y8G7T6_9PSED|nr:hypothetical protein [Pseudomonas reactans]NWE92613.1 hypothetical protein [Pseudomonas reactans]